MIQLIQHFYNSNLRFVCILIFFISWKLYADDEFIIYTAERNNQLDLIARTTVDSEYSVILDYSTITNLAPSTDQTLFNVKGIGDTYLLSLNMTNRAEGYDFKWSYTWNFGFSGENHNDDYVYRLPYSSGSSFSVGQGYFGSFSHEGKYAIDWTMPIGTPIYAAREGRVIHLKEDSNVVGTTEEYTYLANFVLIGHDDGSQANYAHLQQNGVLVEVGDWVSLGQQIGLSGNTGFSTGPHLHFVINQQKSPTNSISIPTKFSDKDGNILSLVEDDEFFGSGEFKDPSLAPALRIGTQINGKTKWRTGSWLGTLFDPAKSWIFHIGMGWFYPVELPDLSVWLFNENLSWVWTREDIYPWIYVHKISGWRYFIKEKGLYDPVEDQWNKITW